MCCSSRRSVVHILDNVRFFVPSQLPYVLDKRVGDQTLRYLVLLMRVGFGGRSLDAAMLQDMGRWVRDIGCVLCAVRDRILPSLLLLFQLSAGFHSI